MIDTTDTDYAIIYNMNCKENCVTSNVELSSMPQDNDTDTDSLSQEMSIRVNNNKMTNETGRVSSILEHQSIVLCVIVVC